MFISLSDHSGIAHSAIDSYYFDWGSSSGRLAQFTQGLQTEAPASIQFFPVLLGRAALLIFWARH